ncbi:MAG: response regulator transcription factor [Bacteroidetes bacterium]|nr:response regulator transcription factor [Bacteroidota bacterium]
MNIFIVEDEDLAVRKLQKTLMGIDPNIVISGTADSISASVEWLSNNPQPDLILMDIELADGQSFEIFNRIKVISPVIFTTSYDEFALKAFKVNSIDYLLKPVQKEDLEAALNKFKALNQKSQENYETKMSRLIQELRQSVQPKEYRRRYLVKYQQKFISIDVDDIAYFYSDDKLTFIKTHDDHKYILDYTMDEIEGVADPTTFFRVNRAFIISVKCIDKIQDYFGNRLKLILQPEMDKEVLVSREKVSDFKVWLGK